AEAKVASVPARLPSGPWGSRPACRRPASGGAMAPPSQLRTKETLPQTTRQPSREPLDLVLRVTGAVAIPPVFPLKSACRIGSSSDCDIAVDHPRVSRKHVTLRLTQDGVDVSDEGSKNGTYYLGQRIERAVLTPGACFQIGPVTVAIHVQSESLAGELAYDGDEYRGVIGQSPAMRRL